MSIFQLLATLFALFMIYVVNIHKKKAALSIMEVIFWYGIWISFIVTAIFPNIFLGIAHRIYFSRVFDLLLVIALMVLTFLVVLTYFNQKILTKKIEDYIRKIALKR